MRFGALDIIKYHNYKIAANKTPPTSCIIIQISMHKADRSAPMSWIRSYTVKTGCQAGIDGSTKPSTTKNLVVTTSELHRFYTLHSMNVTYA